MTKFLFQTIFLSFLFCVSLNAQKTAIAVSKQKLEQTKYDPVAIFIKEHFEIVLLKNEFVTIVDRDINNLTEKEREIQKHESFMDGSYVKQDQAIGAQLIFDLDVDPVKEKLQVNILDVEQGVKIATKQYKIGRFLTNDISIERPKYFGRFIEEKAVELMQELDLGSSIKIELVEIATSKKDKAQEVVLFCKEGCNLKRKSELKIFFEEHNSDSKFFSKRRINIGSVEVSYVESDQVCIAKVKSGHQQIQEAFQNKEKIYGVKDN